MTYLPVCFSPLGWVILGATGYILYKAGKKAGQEGAGPKKGTEPSKKISTEKAKA